MCRLIQIRTLMIFYGCITKKVYLKCIYLNDFFDENCIIYSLGSVGNQIAELKMWNFITDRIFCTVDKKMRPHTLNNKMFSKDPITTM